MKLELHNRVYDVMKWLALIALPALGVLYSALAAVWGWPIAAEVSETVNAVTACLGVLIGVSTASYNARTK